LGIGESRSRGTACGRIATDCGKAIRVIAGVIDGVFDLRLRRG